jgi:hypothetical protein
MPPRVNITVRTVGEQKLARLAAAIKASGDKGLQRELRRSMSRSTAPYRRAAKAGALQVLPHRGGLAEHVAATARITTRVTTSGPNIGVRVTGASRDNLRRMDEEGLVRHPVFGNRRNWALERVHPGWFTDPLILTANAVGSKAVEKAIDELAIKLQRSA